MERERRAERFLVFRAHLVADIVAMKHGPEKRCGVAPPGEAQGANVDRLGRHLGPLRCSRCGCLELGTCWQKLCTDLTQDDRWNSHSFKLGIALDCPSYARLLAEIVAGNLFV